MSKSNIDSCFANRFANCAGGGKDSCFLAFAVVESLSCVELFAVPWTAYARLLCLSPSPGVCSNLCPLNQWCHPTVSSSVTPFSSCLQSFPATKRIAKTQKLATQNAGEDVEQQEPKFFAGGNAKWSSHRETPFDSLLQSEILCYTTEHEYSQVFSQEKRKHMFIEKYV